MGSDGRISVVGQAFTGLETISLVMRLKPDVLVMDMTLPDMASENIIDRILNQNPLPMLILYSQNQRSKKDKIKKQFDIGIIDYLEVSRRANSLNFSDVSITTRVHILAKLEMKKFIPKGGFMRKKVKSNLLVGKSHTELRTNSKFDLLNERPLFNSQSSSVRNSLYSGKNRSSKIVIIGTSTGGPRLLSELVPKFPKNMPPIIIIQHMPVGFISAFAKRLNRVSEIKVKEAEEGESVLPGTVYLAPGGKHLEFYKVGTGVPKILLSDGPMVNFVKPAVDVTLNSAVKVYRQGVISVILTGMGSDGRDGSKYVKDNRGKCLALSEEDSDIYGMNKAVIEAGIADDVLSKKELVLGIIRAIEGNQ